jgi:hypothetical protein
MAASMALEAHNSDGRLARKVRKRKAYKASPAGKARVDRLRRLYLCLLTGKCRAPFHASIFCFPGSSYRNLLVHVMRLVEQTSKSGRVDFSYRMGPPNSSAGAWDEKLTLDAHGRVKISMDPASNPEWDATRDPKRVEGYVARCVQLSGVPRHQKRRKKQAGKGKPAEETMAMDVDR